MKHLINILAVFALLGSMTAFSSKVEASSVDRAYENCIEQAVSKTESDLEGQRMPERHRKQVLEKFNKLAASTCSMVKEQCEKSPEGPVCLGLIEKYTK